MEDDLQRRLDAQDEMLAAIYRSCEKTRKCLFWTLVITVVVFVVPLLALMAIVPTFLSVYLSGLEGL